MRYRIHRSWLALVEQLGELRIVAPDLRGRGRGRGNGLPGPHGMAQHSDATGSRTTSATTWAVGGFGLSGNDRTGNLAFTKAARNFSPLAAMAGRVCTAWPASGGARARRHRGRGAGAHPAPAGLSAPRPPHPVRGAGTA